MNRRLFNVLVASIFLTTSSAQATDYVLKNIGCPTYLTVGLKLPNKIGSDPAFGMGNTNPSSFVGMLSGIAQSGQRISCEYRVRIMASAADHLATYSYTVKRTIIECKQLNSSTLQCKLKP